MRRSLALLLLLALSTAPAARGAEPIAGAGRWLVDGQGRVLTPHGVAVMDFRPPHLPEAVGFGDDDAAFLAEHGFEVVRVGFNWEGIEPRPGVFDAQQIASLARTVRTLGRHGIGSILDAHQDGYGPLVGTDGAPNWAVLSDGAPNNRIAFGVDYFANPALLRAFDNLYANAPAADGAGVADHFAAMWAEVARAVRDEPGLVGYELLNEPYPGSQYATCANPAGCPAFDATLSAFYRRVTARLRAADDRHLVFYEPNLFFDFGADTHLDDPSGGRGGGGFTFHDYCLGAGAGDALPAVPGSGPGCAVEEQMVVDNAVRYATASAQPLLSTEWAATTDLEVTARVADELDAGRVPWTFWLYNDPRLVADPRRPPAGGNLNERALAIVDRPHPRAVAGTPTAWSWEAGSRTARVRYAARSPAGARLAAGARTEIWVGRLHFADGYAAEAHGATVTSRPGADVLTLRNAAGADAVDVTVTPSPLGLPAAAPPCRSRRTFTIRLRDPRGRERLLRARATVAGRRVAVRRRAGRLTLRVDLRGRPAGTVVVRVVARTDRGRVLRESRRYRTCVPRGTRRDG